MKIRKAYCVSGEDNKTCCSTKNYIYMVLVLFLLFTFIQFPSLDDVLFAVDPSLKYENFSELAHIALNYGNGRLLGNLLGFIFANISFKNPIIISVFMTSIISSLCVVVEKLIDINMIRIYLIIAFLLQPYMLLRDTIWVCSFINYYIPILLLCINLLVIKKHKNCECKQKIFYVILVFILGFVQQLFMEHNTIINVMVSMALVFAYIIKKKVKNSGFMISVSMLISNILGAAVMFGYKFYVDFPNTYNQLNDASYRLNIFSVNNITEFIAFPVRAMKNILFISALSIFVVGTLFYILSKAKKHNNSKFIKKAFVICIGSYISFFVATVVILIKNGTDLPDNINKTVAVIALVYMFIFAAFVMLAAILFYKLIIKQLNKKEIIIFSFILFLAIAADIPFFFVSANSWRTFTLTYFLVIFAMLYAIKSVEKTMKIDINFMSKIAIIPCLIVLVVYSFKYKTSKKVIYYCFDYYKTSDVLPASQQMDVHSKNDEVKTFEQGCFDKGAGFKHDYVLIDDFEKIINK